MEEIAPHKADPNEKAANQPAGKRTKMSPFKEQVLLAILSALITSAGLPAFYLIGHEIIDWLELRKEAKETAGFLQSEIIRRLELCAELVKTSKSYGQASGRLLTIISGSGESKGFSLFGRFRGSSLEDLVFHLQVMGDQGPMKPIDRVAALRIAAINAADGNLPEGAFEAFRSDVLHRIEVLAAWAEAKNPNEVSRYMKRSALADGLVKINP